MTCVWHGVTGCWAQCLQWQLPVTLLGRALITVWEKSSLLPFFPSWNRQEVEAFSLCGHVAALASEVHGQVHGRWTGLGLDLGSLKLTLTLQPCGGKHGGGSFLVKKKIFPPPRLHLF